MNKDIESPKELATIIMCYKNWYFYVKKSQRVMTVFVAAST